MAKVVQEVNTEKYAGVSKLSGALGDSTIYGIVAGVASTVIGGGMAVLSKNGAVRKTGVVIAAAGGGLGTIVGLFKGWNKVDASQKQFEALKTEAATKDVTIAGLEAQVTGLNHEVQGHRASFAERHAKKEHASHAEKAGGHHGEHGSHAEAARASQHEAENAQHAM